VQSLTVGIDPGSRQKDQWLCVWDSKNTGRFKPSDYYKFCFKDMHVDEAFSWVWKSKCTNK
jgi:hypothetical protein